MPFAPIINGTYLVKLEAAGEGAEVDYACQISEVVIGAEAGDTNTFDGLCADSSYTSVGPTVWTMTLNYAQDFAAGGLARWLYDHDGEAFTGEINPLGGPAAAGAPSFLVSGRVIAGPIGGGAKGEFAEGEVELPLDGKPELVSVPPTALAAGAETPEEPTNGGRARKAA